MTASEARELSSQVNFTEHANIVRMIKGRAILRKRELHINKPVSDGVIHRLERDGYTVKSSFNRNEILITITW